MEQVKEGNVRRVNGEGGNLVKLSTTRFGYIEVDESRVIMVTEGIPGFEHLKRYAILPLDKKTPFWWFQSVEDGGIAFVVVDPYILKPDYNPVISEDDMRFLKIECKEDMALMVIVTIRSNPFVVSANLRAPIVVNLKKRLAKQIVLGNSSYPVCYNMVSREPVNKVRCPERDLMQQRQPLPVSL